MLQLIKKLHLKVLYVGLYTLPNAWCIHTELILSTIHMTANSTEQM
jgi:hypothetical protein